MSDVKLLGKLWYLIPGNQRRLLPLLGITLFFGALLEVVGIGLLVPLLNLLTDDTASADNSAFEPLFRFFGARTQFQMLTVGCLSLGLMMLIKNTYSG